MALACQCGSWSSAPATCVARAEQHAHGRVLKLIWSPLKAHRRRRQRHRIELRAQRIHHVDVHHVGRGEADFVAGRQSSQCPGRRHGDGCASALIGLTAMLAKSASSAVEPPISMYALAKPARAGQMHQLELVFQAGHVVVAKRTRPGCAVGAACVCCVILPPAEIGLRVLIDTQAVLRKSMRSPLPSAYCSPMIGLPPTGLMRSNVTSSPADLDRSMQRTTGSSFARLEAQTAFRVGLLRQFAGQPVEHSGALHGSRGQRTGLARLADCRKE